MAPIENKETKPSQEDLNLAAYERVYAKALAAALRVLQKECGAHQTVQMPEIIEVARAIFEQYWKDQSSLGASSPTQFYEGLLQSINRMARRI